jgi:hypothetical protein
MIVSSALAQDYNTGRFQVFPREAARKFQVATKTLQQIFQTTFYQKIQFKVL